VRVPREGASLLLPPKDTEREKEREREGERERKIKNKESTRVAHRLPVDTMKKRTREIAGGRTTREARITTPCEGIAGFLLLEKGEGERGRGEHASGCGADVLFLSAFLVHGGFPGGDE